MQEFESIGGRTLKNHGPTISDETLRERLEKHIRDLQNLLGSSSVSSAYMNKFNDHFIKQSIDTGVEYEGGGLFVSTKWITKESMIDDINNMISTNWHSICSRINSKQKADPLNFGGRYYKTGEFFL
ncbi:MAG: hypothetical protein ACRD6U_02085 [Nitrososphaeraceae archaeon]